MSIQPYHLYPPQLQAITKALENHLGIFSYLSFYYTVLPYLMASIIF